MFEIELRLLFLLFASFFTLGEGKMLPKDRLKMVIHNSTGPFLTVRLIKQVMIEMYRIVI